MLCFGLEHIHSVWRNKLAQNLLSCVRLSKVHINIAIGSFLQRIQAQLVNRVLLRYLSKVYLAILRHVETIERFESHSIALVCQHCCLPGLNGESEESIPSVDKVQVLFILRKPYSQYHVVD